MICFNMRVIRLNTEAAIIQFLTAGKMVKEWECPVKRCNEVGAIVVVIRAQSPYPSLKSPLTPDWGRLNEQRNIS